MVPQTWQGKVIASFCALLGISFFALPAVSSIQLHEYKHNIKMLVHAVPAHISLK